VQDRLFSDLKQAMKKGDKLRQSVIRLARAEILNAEKAQGKPLDDPGVIDVLSKEAKKRRESIAEFSKGHRQDLVAKEEAELAILLEYLPPQLSREEIVATARSVIEELGAQGPGDKGRVMGKLMPQLKGKAEGRLVSEVVAELLAGS
jgi:uncharacterized protein YqeY